MATKTKEEVMKENASLKSEVSEMKKMMEQILKAQSETPIQPKASTNTESYAEDELNDVPLTRMIRVMSLFHGTLNLQPNEKKNISFGKFGIIKPIAYSDLIEICDRQRHFAENGYFMILDREVVQNLYLTEIYQNMIGKKEIENIITMSREEITQVYNNAPVGVQEAILDTVIIGAINRDHKFSDRAKLHMLGEITGRNIIKEIETLETFSE